MNAYLDSSVVLRLILGEPDGLPGWRNFERRVCSDLVELECLRTLDRLRLQGSLSGEENLVRREAVFHILEAVERVELSRPLLTRASEAFPVIVGTLDAIHLATALAWREEQSMALIMATHDRTLGLAARAFGMRTAGV